MNYLELNIKWGQWVRTVRLLDDHTQDLLPQYISAGNKVRPPTKPRSS